jgi:tartrate-resistant acid phosphatase type 5
VIATSTTIARVIVLFGLAADPATVRVAAIGDTGLGPGRGGQEAVARRLDAVAAENPVDFALLLGDNFYPAGVKDANDPQWDSAFERMYDLPHLRFPFVATLGNHDHLGSARAEIDYARPGTRWVMEPFPFRWAWPKTDGGQTAVECFAVDTTPAAEKGADLKPELDLLRPMLASSKARWKIVFGHHPIYSDGPHGDTAALAPLRRLLVETGVDVYLSGHDHVLESLSARDRAPDDHVTYLISGAGSSVYSVKKGETSTFAAATLGFALLDFGADSLRVRFYGLDEKVLFEQTVKKAAAPAR